MAGGLEMVHVVLLAVILACTIPPTSWALSYEELIHEVNPVIPKDVRDVGNVTVTRGSEGMVTITFSGLPNHGTMMVNPNDAELQNFQVDFPEEPQTQDEETCLSGGPIGWTVHGVALFNPYTAEGSNAVEGEDAELFDSCQGHADPTGTYHYHQLADACAFATFDAEDIHGIARDGFPIYGQFKEDGSMVQESELDKCHGRCGPDGKYRYHMTKMFPYIIGCFRGTPVEFSSDDGGMMMPPQGDGGGMMGPPTGDDMAPPSGDDRAPRQAGTPNQCAYNRDEGPNYEFQTCSGTPESNDQGGTESPNGSGDTGTAGHIKVTLILFGLTSIIACVTNVLI